VTRRIAAFVTIGGLGFVLQLMTLWWLATWAGWNPLPATAIAVELAVLHNFWWHERWTWRDRRAPTPDAWLRLARYHAATGMTAVGNVIVTLLLAKLGIQLLAANIAGVAAMSALNFVLSDRWTFAPGQAVRAR
jgi:putative flippase GtrA